jgi:hypothetical protein
MTALALGFAIGLPLFFLLDFLDRRPCRQTRMHLRKATSIPQPLRDRYIAGVKEHLRSELKRKETERCLRFCEGRATFSDRVARFLNSLK